MNLHAIVAPYVGIINPPLPVTVRVSTGSTIGPDGTRVPTYSTSGPVSAQVQALTFRDLTQVSGLNLNGTRRGIYLSGDVEGLVRSQGKGGDLITFPDGSEWLVALVLEAWGASELPMLTLGGDPMLTLGGGSMTELSGGTPDQWCKVACTLQSNG